MDISILDIKASNALMLFWLGGTLAILLIALIDISVRSIHATLKAAKKAAKKATRNRDWSVKRWLGLNRGSFSRYSYKDEKGVYAEEDCDAGILIGAMKEKEIEFTFKEVYQNQDHWIRNLAGC